MPETGAPGNVPPRIEDDRLLRGHGQFTDDLFPSDGLAMVILRSPVAHGRISNLDVADAERASGVRAVITARTLANGGVGTLDTGASVDDISGQSMNNPPRPVLATDKVVYVGQPVVAIIAESVTAAADALEQITLDIEDLPVVSHVADAARSPAIWPEAPGNRAFTWEHGNTAQTEAAFASADHVVELTVDHPRIAISPVETRACVASYSADNDTFELIAPSQGVVGLRRALSACLDIAPERLRVITRDVGGSFAVKIWPYPEHVCALFAARLTGSPITWLCDRIESFGADIMGRARIDHARLALSKDGLFQAFSIHATTDMGAFLNTAAPLIVTEGSVRTLGNVYKVPGVSFRVDAMFTNLVPTDAYRGAGKPETTTTMERLIDVAARELGIDPFEIREKNLLQPADMPYQTPVGVTYDAGNYPALAARLKKASQWHDSEARRANSRQRGLQRGLGIGFYVHVTGGSPAERTEVRALPDGTVLVRSGTQDTGQGHRTALAMVASEALDLPIEQIRVEQGDSAWLDQGGGTGGSNLMAIAGNNVHKTSLQMLEHAHAVASGLFEAAPADIEYRHGQFSIAGTDRRLTLAELASGFEQMPAQQREADMGEGCVARLDFDGVLATAPGGAYACEVDVDPQTGEVQVVQFVAVDDLGRIFNPSTVDGQLHGSIAQSIGEVLMEGMRYDSNGQILNGSLMDYALPRASDVPMMQLHKLPTDSPNSALGVKGVGEVASIGAPGVIMNAVLDALAPLGVKHLDIPITSEKIWRAIQSS